MEHSLYTFSSSCSPMARGLVFVSWPPRSPSSSLPSSLLPQPLFRRQQSPHVVKFSRLFQSGGSLPCSQKPASSMPFMKFRNILVLLSLNICFLSVRPTSCRFPHIHLSATVYAIYPQFLSISGDPTSFHNVRTRHDLLTRDTEKSFVHEEGIVFRLTSFQETSTDYYWVILNLRHSQFTSKFLGSLP